jgi:dolichol kinase
MINKPQKEKYFGLFIFSIRLVRVSLFVFQVNDKGNAVIGTRYGRLNGMFGANEM